MRVEITAPYAIIDYTWDLLKLNTQMDVSDYGNRIPIIPSSQQPEFTESGKPYIVYAYTENPTNEVYAIRGGQIAYAVYGTSDRDINTILNILATQFGRFDETAEDINNWSVGKVFQGLRFTNLSINVIEGPGPEDAEGGPRSGVTMIRYECIPTYEIVKP